MKTATAARPIAMTASQARLFQFATRQREQAVAIANAEFSAAVGSIRTELGFEPEVNVVVEHVPGTDTLSMRVQTPEEIA